MFKPFKAGFTLIEILVVIAVIAILSTTGLITLSKQRTKAVDASMKNDLNRLKIAFEDYYNDHNCYPPESWFDTSNPLTGAELQPYLSQIPLNKKTSEPYVLETDTTGCSWFKIYTTLNNPDDPQAVLLRTLDPTVGSTLGNYGVSSSNTTVSIYYNPSSSTPSSTPNPSQTPSGRYYCQSFGNCSEMAVGQTCSPSYADANCGSTNLCANIVSTCQ